MISLKSTFKDFKKIVLIFLLENFQAYRKIDTGPTLSVGSERTDSANCELEIFFEMHLY
jgi:hypothetical protein